MTDAEMLKQLIDLAVSRGFVMDNHHHFCEIGRNFLSGEIEHLGAYESILFDQEFAKAVFGNERVRCWTGSLVVEKPDFKDMANWQFHLQKMVLASHRERIEYAWSNKI